MDNDVLQAVIAVFLVFAFLFILVGIAIGVPLYYSSCAQSRIYNQKNNTNYTCSDFFWAGEQINSQTQTIRLEK